MKQKTSFLSSYIYDSVLLVLNKSVLISRGRRTSRGRKIAISANKSPYLRNGDQGYYDGLIGSRISPFDW